MRTTAEVLDDLKKLLKKNTDCEMAKLFLVTRDSYCGWRHGKRMSYSSIDRFEDNVRSIFSLNRDESILFSGYVNELRQISKAQLIENEREKLAKYDSSIVLEDVITNRDEVRLSGSAPESAFLAILFFNVTFIMYFEFISFQYSFLFPFWGGGISMILMYKAFFLGYRDGWKAVKEYLNSFQSRNLIWLFISVLATFLILIANRLGYAFLDVVGLILLCFDLALIKMDGVFLKREER